MSGGVCGGGRGMGGSRGGGGFRGGMDIPGRRLILDLLAKSAAKFEAECAENVVHEKRKQTPVVVMKDIKVRKDIFQKGKTSFKSKPVFSLIV